MLVDARECVITDASHTRAKPDLKETRSRVFARVKPLVEGSRVPVLGGFIGGTADGIPTTLGRNGSDISAAIIAAALGAQRIEIWTDVDGVMTADPKIVPEARLVPELSYEAAVELAQRGARVLHPAAVAPAQERNIPIHIRNSRHPKRPGTRISNCSYPKVGTITAQTSIDLSRGEL